MPLTPCSSLQPSFHFPSSDASLLPSSDPSFHPREKDFPGVQKPTRRACNGNKYVHRLKGKMGRTARGEYVPADNVADPVTYKTHFCIFLLYNLYYIFLASHLAQLFVYPLSGCSLTPSLPSLPPSFFPSLPPQTHLRDHFGRSGSKISSSVARRRSTPHEILILREL